MAIKQGFVSRAASLQLCVFSSSWRKSRVNVYYGQSYRIMAKLLGTLIKIKKLSLFQDLSSYLLEQMSKCAGFRESAVKFHNKDINL